MAEKKQAKKTAAAPAPGARHSLSIESLEDLFNTILCEYIQVSTVPSGRCLSIDKTAGGGDEVLHMSPACHFEPNCPVNLQAFLSTAPPKTLTRQSGYEWWSRSRLRYSCSMLVCTFVKFLVPELQKAHGVAELYSTTLGRIIQLEDLEIYSIGFLPNKTHRIMIHNPVFETLNEPVEALQGWPPHCSHNMLVCRTTGIVVDLAMGQFLGTIEPFVFESMAEFRARLPGQILDTWKISESNIQEQIARDNSARRRQQSPDSTPKRFVQRVLSKHKVRMASHLIVGIAKELHLEETSFINVPSVKRPCIVVEIVKSFIGPAEVIDPNVAPLQRSPKEWNHEF